MDLINSDVNQDQRSEFPINELFGITEYKDNKIRFHIFDDLRFNLIENGSDHNIEFIEEHGKVII